MLLTGGLVVLAALTAMAIVGWVIVAANHNTGHRSFAVTVRNNRSDAVTIQPCARYFCNKLSPVELPAGSSYTWQTNDDDAGIDSFVVEAASRGRILGCLAQHGGVSQLGDQVMLRVSDLKECVT
jgi:hypothetical protein